MWIYLAAIVLFAGGLAELGKEETVIENPAH